MIYTVINVQTKRAKSGKTYYSFTLKEGDNSIQATGFTMLNPQAKYDITIVQNGTYNNIKQAFLVEDAPVSLAPSHLRKLNNMENRMTTFETKVNKLLEQQKEMLTKMAMFEMFFKAMGGKN